MHHGDTSPLDTLQRLADKAYESPVPLAKFKILERKYDAERIMPDPDPEHHKGTEPKRTDCPIILLDYDYHMYMIDGRNRVNKWLEQGDTDKHRCLVVKPCLEDEQIEEE